MEISEKEQKSIANFKYWIDTNTERGVCYLPDYICAKVLNLIEKLQKENEELKNQEATARRINELLVQRYSNSIPVQKVKDKIEELNQYYKKEIYPSLYQWGDKTITEHYDEMIGLLQELLGDK